MEVCTIHLGSELALDSVLPEQLFGSPFGGARLQPEKRLQVAALADAVLTFHRWAGNGGPRARHLFAEVEAWFASHESHGPFTFITICDSLQLDPGYIRRGLGHWRARQEVMANRRRRLRRESHEIRHQVALPRLRRVA